MNKVLRGLTLSVLLSSSLALSLGVLSLGVLGLGMSQPLQAADQSRIFYRYLNSDGVKVMNHTLPAKYAQTGYEVVSLSGEVIKVVPPALSKEEADRLAATNSSQKELAAWDKRLHRRFSSVEDIEAAKQRKLAGINTNTNILTGNIEKLKVQLATEQTRAAEKERLGRTIPESLLKNIANIEAEIKTSEETVTVRREEYQAVVTAFDKDIERFRLISQ